uniref:hypothetical protein n=1 Tax=Cephaleuros parasiticus TaxID=173370 RepID=UPI001EDDB063|nr:hypothetical protein MFQ79_pgp003 [Cephaleuros parasiticus]UIB38954.1 hypothetical protein [Cephaleuros parasiticus]
MIQTRFNGFGSPAKSSISKKKNSSTREGDEKKKKNEGNDGHKSNSPLSNLKMRLNGHHSLHFFFFFPLIRFSLAIFFFLRKKTSERKTGEKQKGKKPKGFASPKKQYINILRRVPFYMRPRGKNFPPEGFI